MISSSITMLKTQDRRLLLLPLAMMIGGAILLASRTPGIEWNQVPDQSVDTPQACIVKLLSAEDRGDLGVYLGCLSSETRQRMQSRWQGRSRSDIAGELRHSSVGVLGHAILEVTYPDPNHAELIVERICEGHTTRQQVRLARKDSDWQITEAAAPIRQTPRIPYGTPVNQ